jgi:hypothetical protein
MAMKSLDNIIKEIKRFDEMYNSHIKEDTNENTVKKIQFWLNLIKNDLSGERNEILARIESGKSQFLNEIKSRNDTIKSSCHTNPDDFNNNDGVEQAFTEESPNMNEKDSNGYNKNMKTKIIINKNKSTSLLYSNLNRGTNSIGKKKIPALYISANNIESYKEHKTLFKKLNYLKINSPTNFIKIRNFKNITKLNKNNGFISEEINDSLENNNDNNKYMFSSPNKNPKININTNSNNNLNNQELESILNKDYKELSDEEYRELLNKKEQYLESNLRLEKNIEEIKRTKNKKLSSILRVLKDNLNSLENIKQRNSLLESEISNLCNVFKLTLEKAKLQCQLNNKNKTNNKKKLKYKLKPESGKSDENKLVKSQDKIPKDLNFNEIVYPIKRRIKSININIINKKKNKSQSREEQLKMIREKYKDDRNEFNDISQIKENELEKSEEKGVDQNNAGKNDIVKEDENKIEEMNMV